ncbi:MAG: bifunctional (p)ppGpp synthetase/guanosine-3',5'-bis(diphosphate) 3'-pyrophosphohydrolase [Actinobacteria bacterium]|jgi:GTP diphosphokinase / guanosine-3',5'-bis(diphosphate) 3'-diphosphatase|nr:bifunctional (p)ppGpp synthetase/guanosine-3',5'-bis(diphosphate) 3'-pyrophosphohydrolase [Actinomycetota bacterium]
MSTTSRVLPWRRNQSAVVEDLVPLLSAYKRRNPKGSVSLINAAYEMASAAHINQSRMSGELYISHPIAVARIVAEIGLDEVSLVAALLHDAVEDTEITLTDVEARFGSEVAGIVDGLTKLERLQFDSREAQQAATMRKMLVAMAKDMRVLIIKLADRMHNMRTIASASVDKQRRVAQETLDIYAPLAHRLGMQEMKQQLEDLSFAALFPKRYAELEYLVSIRAPERDVYLAKALGQVNTWLNAVNINAELTARGKHLWSLYEKMVQKGRDFDEIFDLMAIRIVVDSVKDCYGALGAIHGHWKPVVGRFKDYIAMPKFNLYQSLHTTVIGPGGKPIEVQIRSRDMHQRAEWGVASHWSYKDGVASSDIDWLNRIIDWQDEVSDPRQFLESLKTDLEQDELFVFTPKGRVIALPLDSTPVDFAYGVHTEVGHNCIGARVNGRLVALDSRLNSGDTCEILTSTAQDAGPSEEWANFVVSPKAKSKIKQWFSRERMEDLVETGRDDLVEHMRKHGLPVQRVLSSEVFASEREAMNYADDTTLFRAIGEGHVSAESLAGRISRLMRDGGFGEQLSVGMRLDSGQNNDQVSGIHVEGMSGSIIRLSKCCTPVPGDEIVGFLTQDHVVNIHRADCSVSISAASQHVGRMVDVEWAGSVSNASYVAAVEVVALDRSRLLRDVANALSEEHVNIVACSTHTGADRVARMRFEFEFADPSHLQSVLRTIKRIDSVYDAYRVMAGDHPASSVIA